MKPNNIYINEPNRAIKSRYFIGDRERLATMTSVCFIDESKLVSAHLVGETMHLIEYDSVQKEPQTLDVIKTTYNGHPTITDLIDFDGDSKILTSNFDESSGSLYRLDGSKLHYLKDVPLPNTEGKCHGGRFYSSNIVCLTTNINEIYFINIRTDSVISKLEMPYHIKDVCFINQTTMLACFAIKSPSSKKKATYASGFLYISFNLEKSSFTVIDKWFLRPCAFDALCFDKRKKRFYATDQVGDRVIIAEIKRDRISIIGEYIGFNFPHGIDTRETLLAVTNYGDSSISFIDTNSSLVMPVTGSSTRRRPYTIQEIIRSCRNHARRLIKSASVI